MVCPVAAVKVSPYIIIASADYSFFSRGITEFILSHFDNRVPLKPVIGGRCKASVAHFITGHQSAVFISLVYSYLPKDLTMQSYTLLVYQYVVLEAS